MVVVCVGFGIRLEKEAEREGEFIGPNRRRRGVFVREWMDGRIQKTSCAFVLTDR